MKPQQSEYTKSHIIYEYIVLVSYKFMHFSRKRLAIHIYEYEAGSSKVPAPLRYNTCIRTIYVKYDIDVSTVGKFFNYALKLTRDSKRS